MSDEKRSAVCKSDHTPLPGNCIGRLETLSVPQTSLHGCGGMLVGGAGSKVHERSARDVCSASYADAIVLPIVDGAHELRTRGR